MIYILLIWTVVGASDSRGGPMKSYHDWRPLGEFQAEVSNIGFQNGKTAQQMCEEAARQLGLKSENYRCVRSK
jgi:hypothetical protein